jgi:hypothetical protein
MSVFSHPRRSLLPAWTGEALVADNVDGGAAFVQAGAVDPYHV